MSEPGTPTFDQLRIFLAVIESGSFAGAARRLGRATSAISYGIANLEAQLGIRLFERHATRKPKLTDAGHAVLAETRMIGQGVAGLRAKVKGLLDGLEAQVDLAIDVMVPMEWLVDILDHFADQFPTVALNLHVEALGAVAALVLERKAVVAIGGPLASEMPGVETVHIGSIPLVPVAAPGHPLARTVNLHPGMAREHVQLVLTDRSRLTAGREFGVVSPRTWRLADLSVKHALLCKGVGWGNMPRPMVEADLASGRLVELVMPDDTSADYRLSCIYRSDAPPGPAASWLFGQFAEVSRRGGRPAGRISKVPRLAEPLF